MALDLEEQEQLAELKAWWKQHGNLIVAAIVGRGARLRRLAGLALVPGEPGGAGRGGSTRRWCSAAQANDAKALRDAAGTLIESYPRTLYASMGALVAARFHFDRNDLKAAKAQLQWVVDKSPVGGFPRPGAPAPGGGAARREGVRRGAQAARGEARRRPTSRSTPRCAGDVLVAKSQPAEARAAYKLALEKADAGTRAPSARACACASRRSAAELRRSAFLAGAAAARACSRLLSGPAARRAGRTLDKPQPVRVLWSADVGAAENFIFTPALVGDALYAAARDGTVTRLDAASGDDALARGRCGSTLSGGVGADARTVAVATEEGEVVALDAASGKRALARARLERGAGAARGRRRAGAGAQRRQPRVRVRRRRRQAALGLPARAVVAAGARAGRHGAAPAICVYAGFTGGKLVALALDNGAAALGGDVHVPKGATELERVTDVVGAPVGAGARGVRRRLPGRASRASTPRTAASSGRATCPRADAASAWTRATRTSPTSAARCTPSTAATASSVWKQDKLAHRQLSLPLPAARTVAVGDLRGLRALPCARHRRLRRAPRHRRRGGARRAPALRQGASWCRPQNGRRCFAL